MGPAGCGPAVVCQGLLVVWLRMAKESFKFEVSSLKQEGGEAGLLLKT